MQHSDELCRLYDRLNLTGQVFRVGRHAVSGGGCSNIWEGRLERAPGAEPEKVAVKVLREVGSASEASLRKRLIREMRAWSKLYHRNVLTLLGFTYGFAAASSTLASLVSPWMQKGTATRYLEGCSTSERIRVLTGIADGLCYLHRHDIVHGDLKGDNILIDKHIEPRLADFGLSKLLTEVSDTKTMTETAGLLGSIRWMARELFGRSPGVTCESDIWAFGMTVVELFTSLPPFHYLKRETQVIIEVHGGALPKRPENQKGIDDDLWNLCNDCWNENPELRPSTRVITKRLWDLDLRCKLRSRPKRRQREPDSPDSGERGKNERSSSSLEGRLRKSPKLSLLAELSEESSPSPGSPLPVHGALVRTPTPRSSSMSTSASTSRSSPPRSSRSDLANEVDPRRLFSNAHSDGDIYTNLYNHHLQRTRTQRAYSETAAQYMPTQHQYHASEASGLGLSLDASADINALGFDPSVALTTPRQGYYDMGDTSPGHAAYPLGPLQQQQQDSYYSQSVIGNGSQDGKGLYLTDYEQVPQYAYAYDAAHPSQWTAFYPPYPHAPSSSSFSQQPPSESVYYNDYNDLVALQEHHLSSLHSTLLPPLSAGDGPRAMLGNSPQEQLLSPHALGPIFSEAFISDVHTDEHPLTSSPLLNEPLLHSSSYSNPNQNQNPNPNADYHYSNDDFTRPPYRPPPAVDFTSLQHGVVSPALSDASVEFVNDHDPALNPVVDTPVFADGDAFEEFDDASGLSLFGGFGVADSGSDVHEGTAFNGRGGGGGDAGGGWRLTPPPDDADRTPHASPRQLEFALPLRGGMQMPPTPRLSPLLSSF